MPAVLFLAGGGEKTGKNWEVSFISHGRNDGGEAVEFLASLSLKASTVFELRDDKTNNKRGSDSNYLLFLVLHGPRVLVVFWLLLLLLPLL